MAQGTLYFDPAYRFAVLADPHQETAPDQREIVQYRLLGKASAAECLVRSNNGKPRKF